MEFFSGMSFAYMTPRGFTDDPKSMESLRLMFECTGSDTLLLTVAAMQDHTYSTQIDWTTPDVMSEADIRACIAYARSLGKKVILKAMVNCRDEYWRAYINFFDIDVPCEPKWKDWFANYIAFTCYLAEIAEDTHADLFCIGCEMVGADRKVEFWMQLIEEVRKRYSGLISYNCDKYQEDRVTWWDAVDVISSSGYYPIDDIDAQFARIQKVVDHYQKPFMFMECGCPCREGSEYIPNSWTYQGKLNIDVQTRWYRTFLEALDRNPWIQGVGWWDWRPNLYPIEQAMENDDYVMYGKPAAKLLLEWNQKHSRA
jgi:hypothetical protein